MSSHDQVAHNWAHQTGRARRGFNVFYEGPTIYSYGYHFPIARFVETKAGRVVLFTAESRSVSTAKHKSITARAIPSAIPCFTVNNVMARNKSEHKANRAAMITTYHETLRKAARARTYGPLLIREAEQLRQQINAYSRTFALGYRDLKSPCSYRQALEKIEEEAKRREQEKIARDRKAIRKWLNGETDHAPRTTRPYVRVKGDMVQTSWGITVPLRQALAVFRLAGICRAKGETFQPVKRHTLANWPLDRIDSSGTVRAGCHVIAYDVQRQAAALAGLA